MSNQRTSDTQSVYSISSAKNLVGVKTRSAYFRKRRQISLVFIILTVLAITILSIIITVLSILYAKSAKYVELCDTEACLRIAASLKESMDTSANPCDDFHKYACGRWPESHPSMDDHQEQSWFSDRSGRISRSIREMLRKNLTGDDVPWAVQQAKLLYESCLDIDEMNDLNLEPLLQLLEELALPQVPAAFTNEASDFTIPLAKVKRVLWTDVFIGLSVLPDPRNNSRRIIALDAPEWENPFPGDRILEKRLQKIRKQVFKMVETPDENEYPDTKSLKSMELLYMSEVIKEIISNGTIDHQSCKTRKPFSAMPEGTVEEVVDQLYELTLRIAVLINAQNNVTIGEDEILDDSDYMLIDDIQIMTDAYVKSINESLEPKKIWRPFVEEVLKDIVDFNPKEKILVLDADFLNEIALILAETDDTIIETLIWWSVVDYSVQYSSKDLRNTWYSYMDVLMETELSTPRSLYCSNNVNELMGMAVAWLFVNPDFHKGDGQKVQEMVENIRSAFASLVIEADWMDKSTKFATLEKSSKMKSLIGFPSWLFDDGELDSYYDQIDMSNSMFFDNMVQIIRTKATAKFAQLLNNRTDEPFWPIEPTEVNAVHTFQENQTFMVTLNAFSHSDAAIPAGILQFPFYGLGLEALNYGAIGTILGHELTHGFDNSGRLFDSNGNIKQWWSNETISKYREKTKCFIEQYSQFYEPEVDDYIDGELTLGENIADNGGLREAYRAYQRWKLRHKTEPFLPGFTHLSHDQLLFLGFAHMWCESYTTRALEWMLEDAHCPSHVRLQAVLKNSPTFSAAWNCPVGSKMNPEKKCQLW